MLVPVEPQLSQFASDVAEGLSRIDQKKIAPRYFYDDLGSTLFEAITLLPEYGLTRADERLLARFAEEIASFSGEVSAVAELGSGSGKKTRHILQAVVGRNTSLRYLPIDVSAAALEACERELQDVCAVTPVCGDWTESLARISADRTTGGSLLLLFLGSSVGNLDRDRMPSFFEDLRRHLKPGDSFLLGADLVKDPDVMIAAYDDPTGVTAAFNMNVLGRMNRELDANFDLRAFAHEVRWNNTERRIEMHLLSCRAQDVFVGALDKTFIFQADETIWTESSHKFTLDELNRYATDAGFETAGTWVDNEWPFVETLWRVR